MVCFCISHFQYAKNATIDYQAITKKMRKKCIFFIELFGQFKKKQ